MALTKSDAYERVLKVEKTLARIVVEDNDTEQEVRSIAVPAIDAAFEAARRFLADDDPLVAASFDIISADTIAAGEPIRAMDAWIVAGQLATALYKPLRRGGLKTREPRYDD